MEQLQRVLVVDDDDAIRTMVSFAFELEGYDVATASDGIEAIAAVEKFLPDVMVLDIMMPRMDGLTVLNHLRNKPSTARVPVVLLSAKADSADVAIGRRAGASDYITKPFETEDLLERARRAMQEPVPHLVNVTGRSIAAGPRLSVLAPSDEERQSLASFIAPDPAAWDLPWSVVGVAGVALLVIVVLVVYLLR